MISKGRLGKSHGDTSNDGAEGDSRRSGLAKVPADTRPTRRLDRSRLGERRSCHLDKTVLVRFFEGLGCQVTEGRQLGFLNRQPDRGNRFTQVERSHNHHICGAKEQGRGSK